MMCTCLMSKNPVLPTLTISWPKNEFFLVIIGRVGKTDKMSAASYGNTYQSNQNLRNDLFGFQPFLDIVGIKTKGKNS